MNSFMSFGIKLACRRLDELGDPLSGLKPLIDWDAFHPILEGIYDNRTEKGGHPNYNEVLMIEILVLQHWYSLSDQKMELEMAKNISFMRFLDFQEDIDRWNGKVALLAVNGKFVCAKRTVVHYH